MGKATWMDLTRQWPFGLSRRNAAAFLLAAMLVLLVLHQFDRSVSDFSMSAPSAMLDGFRWLTRWGQSDWVLIPALLVFITALAGYRLLRDRPGAALGELAALSSFIFLGVGLPGLAAAILKRLFGRGRPEVWLPDAPLSLQPFNLTTYAYQSFPSGHATTSFALATVIGLLWPRALLPALAVAATIAASRIALGEHYLTDVTAGAVLGVLGACLVRNVFARRGWRFTAEADRVCPRPIVAIPALFRN